MERSRPVPSPKAHDPKWVHTHLHQDTQKWTGWIFNLTTWSDRCEYEGDISLACILICMFVLFVVVLRCVFKCILWIVRAKTSPRSLLIPSPLCSLIPAPCSSPCSSGVTPLRLIYLTKCLKPRYGNPSAPVKVTPMLWLLRRQDHTYATPHLSSFVLSNCCSCQTVFLCVVLTLGFYVLLCRIEGIAFIDE